MFKSKGKKIKKFLLISFLFISGIQAVTTLGYSAKLLTQQDALEVVPFIAEQITTEFAKYPYLYKNDDTAEIVEYYQSIMSKKHACVAVAYYGIEPVGFIVAVPCYQINEGLYANTDLLFAAFGFDFEKSYYITDIIIMPEHRRNGLANKLHVLIEEYVRSLNYDFLFLAEESHDFHSLKPKGYKEIAKEFFTKKGYTQTDMVIKFDWNTFQLDGSVKDQEHALSYWIKNFN